MRWPFTRRQPAQYPASEAGFPLDTAPIPVQAPPLPDRPTRYWRRLSPLSATFEPEPPILAPFLAHPSIAGTRDVLTRRPMPVGQPELTGRVSGLTTYRGRALPPVGDRQPAGGPTWPRQAVPPEGVPAEVSDVDGPHGGSVNSPIPTGYGGGVQPVTALGTEPWPPNRPVAHADVPTGATVDQVRADGSWPSGMSWPSGASAGVGPLGTAVSPGAHVAGFGGPAATAGAGTAASTSSGAYVAGFDEPPWSTGAPADPVGGNGSWPSAGVGPPGTAVSTGPVAPVGYAAGSWPSNPAPGHHVSLRRQGGVGRVPSAVGLTTPPAALPAALPAVLPAVLPTALPTAPPNTRPTALPTTPAAARPGALPTAPPTVWPGAFPAAPPTASLSAPPGAFPATPPAALPAARPTVPPTARPGAFPAAPPAAAGSAPPGALPAAVPAALPGSAFPAARPTAPPGALPAAPNSGTTPFAPAVGPVPVGAIEPSVQPGPPPRRVGALSTPTDRPQLVRATDEWVGEAQEPAVPFRNMTQFDRLVAHFESMDITEAVALAGIPGAGGLISSAPPSPVEVRRAPKRTLGESRRLGLRGSPGEQVGETAPHSTQDGRPGADRGPPLASVARTAILGLAGGAEAAHEHGPAAEGWSGSAAPVAEPDQQPVGDSWTLAGGFTSEPAGGAVPPEPPRQDEPPDGAANGIAAIHERLAALDHAVAELRDHRPQLDFGNARDLDVLAGHLYRYLRSRLRAELIIDRERSGRLADTR